MKKLFYLCILIPFLATNSSCNKEIEGCTDNSACNYNEEANTDNGLCEYHEVNYDCSGSCINDVDNDGICDEDETLGCIDSLACNFVMNATDSDSSCVYALEFYDCDGVCINDMDGDEVCDELEVSGCDDDEACNYNTTATDNDGSCEYPEEYYDCEGSCNQDMDDDGICDELEIMGCTDSNACNYNTEATEEDGNCIYAIEYYDCSGTCINDADSDGVCDENEILGCTDESACDFNTEATDEDNSCTYAEEGYNCDGEEIVQIGDFIYGGIVFYVDETEQHGLVCAPSNLMAEYDMHPWLDINVNTSYIEIEGGTSSEIGSGYSNTMTIINSQGIGVDAASLCSQLNLNGYDDWFLPSLNELWELYYNREIINEVAVQNEGELLNDGWFQYFYWSSSEKNLTQAWQIMFNTDGFSSNGGQPTARLKQNADRVRPVRAF